MNNTSPGGMMLQAWLVAEGRKSKWMAEQIGVTESMMSGWTCRGILPVKPYRKAIASVTAGAVPENAWTRA